MSGIVVFFFFNDTATTEIYTRPYTLSLHDALPISCPRGERGAWRAATTTTATGRAPGAAAAGQSSRGQLSREPTRHGGERGDIGPVGGGERHPVELLEQVAQLAQRRVGTRALDD